MRRSGRCDIDHIAATPFLGSVNPVLSCYRPVLESNSTHGVRTAFRRPRSVNTIRFVQGVFMKKFAAAVSLVIAAGAASASGITYQKGGSFESGLADSAAYQSDVSARVGAPIAISSLNDFNF